MFISFFFAFTERKYTALQNVNEKGIQLFNREHCEPE